MKLVEREGALVAATIAYLNARGAFAWRNQSGVVGAVRDGKVRAIRLGRAGLPDVMAALPPAGRLLAVECKRAGGRLNPDQIRAIDELRRRGVLVVVAYSITDVEAALGAL